MLLEFVNSIHAIDASEWNKLCPLEFPFIRHEFLAALEDSGSTVATQGWQPHHLLWREQNQLVMAIPLFIKTHSYGEYVFDWRWADAYSRHGFSYYPKLINAIPFTPCYGPRWLSAYAFSATLIAEIAAVLHQESRHLKASGWHCLFPDAELNKHLSTAGCVTRLGCQFHWFNSDYGSFDHFLARMNSRKRKNILKERRQVAAEGFTFRWLEGDAITKDHWDFFYSLYVRTYSNRSGHRGYLTQEFFQQLGQTMPNHTLLIVAECDGQPLAAALFLRDSTTLYGRYWGCLHDYDFLHFETCYYQGIDYAIARNLQRFDGGAQGEHKIQRGFTPLITFSNHWLSEPMFLAAVQTFCAEEARVVERYWREASQLLPFKSGIASEIFPEPG